jgi:hypothetical protein
MVDLSEAGARIADAPRLAIGTRGMLDVNAIGAHLPFTVRNQYGDTLGLFFDTDATTLTTVGIALETLMQHAA